MGKGGGGSGQTTSTTNTSNIPQYAQPYVENMLGATQNQLFNTQKTGVGGYDAQGNVAANGGYDQNGNVQAGTTELTSFKPYQPYSTNPENYVAGFSPMQQQAFGDLSRMQVAPQIGQASGIAGDASRNGMGYGMAGFNAGMSYGQNAQDPNAVAAYMNPYLQNTLNPAMQLLNQQYGQQSAAEQGAATSAGAFGGSRNALMSGLGQQNRMLAGNQLVGNAYNQAYNTANQNMQQASALGMQGAAQGIAGANTALQGANTLGSLGMNQYNQQMGINQAQLSAGALQQQREQQKINQSVQDYANAQQYPLMQLGTMSNMLRGLPMQSSTTNQYMAAPNPVTQGVGAAGSLAYMNSAMQPKTGAKGGIMQAYSVGGEIKASLENMSLQQLQQYMNQSSSPEAKRMAQELIREKTMEQQFQEQQHQPVPQQLAKGGITEVQRFQNGPPKGEAVSTSEDDPLDRVYAGAMAPPAKKLRTTGFSVSDKEINEPSLTYTPPSEIKIPAPEDATNLSNWEAQQRETIQNVTLNAERQAMQQEQQNKLNAALQMQGNERQMQDADSQVQPRGITAVPSPSGAPQVAAQPNVPGVDTQGAVPQGAGIPQGGGVPQGASAGIAGVPGGGAPGGIKAPQQYTLTEAMKEIQDAKKEVGLGENKEAQEYRSKLMAERANLGDEATRQRHMRAAEFFATWGSTPGNTLVAGMHALKKTIPDMIADDREQAKARKEADKIIYELDQSVRAEKLGDFEKAATFKQKASEMANQFNMKLIDLEGHKVSAGATLGAAQIREKSEDARLKQTIAHQTEQDKINNKRADIAAAAQKTAADKAEAQQTEIDRKNLEREYLDAERLVLQSKHTYETQQKNWDKFKTSDEWKQILLFSKLSPKGADENQKNNIADAIAKKAAYEAEHENELKKARESESYYRRLARSKIPKTSGATSTEKPPANAFDSQ